MRGRVNFLKLKIFLICALSFLCLHIGKQCSYGKKEYENISNKENIVEEDNSETHAVKDIEEIILKNNTEEIKNELSNLNYLNIEQQVQIVSLIDSRVIERYNRLEEQGLIKDGLLQDPIIEGELKEEIENALNISNLDEFIDPEIITDWSSGVASAYGGYGDAPIIDNQITATGDAVTESSMGVAIPMAWSNFRSYYGKKVVIEYNGKYVTATVNDCGGMANGARHLDLQPGVFKAFGYDNCNDWGLRTVRYKILD